MEMWSGHTCTREASREKRVTPIQRVVAFAGFALFILTLVLGFYSSSELIGLASSGQSGQVFFHLLVAGTEVLILLVITFVFRRDDQMFFAHPLRVALITGMMGLLFFVLLLFSRHMDEPLAATIGAALALGCTLAILFAFWCSQLAGFSYRGSYLVIIGAHGFATLCDRILIALPPYSSSIAILVAILLSCFCMALQTNEEPATNPPSRTEPRASLREALPLLRDGVLTVCVFAFISGLILRSSGGAVSDPFALQEFMLIVSVAVLVVMLIPLLVTKKPLKLETSYLIALPLSTLGFIVVPFLVGGLPTGISGILVTAGYMLTGMVLYCTIAEAARVTGAPVLPLFACCELIVLSCYIIGSVLSYPLTDFVSGAWGGVAIIGLALFYLAMLSIISLPARLKTFRQLLPNGREKRGPLADVATLTALHGLTEREAKILALIATGRTLSRIGEELALSTSGIKYHAHILYRKLGVNSRDELLSLVSTTEKDSATPLDANCSNLSQLTPREREIAYLLARGKTPGAITQELVISMNTVKSHIRTIYTKLNVHSRWELVEFLQRGEAAENNEGNEDDEGNKRCSQ